METNDICNKLLFCKSSNMHGVCGDAAYIPDEGRHCDLINAYSVQEIHSGALQSVFL